MCAHHGHARAEKGDREALRAAQADPKSYRNLLVRMTGYNGYFATLGRENQDEIIARKAHRA